jgi:RNA polymerase sigma-70 factor, ECF subfamily
MADADPLSPHTESGRRAAADLQTVDEEALVEALRAGAPGAFEQLVRTNIAHMRAVALRYLGCEHQADDAVQEAFLSALRSLDRFENRSRLSTWLHRITANVALMMLRSRRPVEPSPLDSLGEQFSSHGFFLVQVKAWRQDEIDAVAQEEIGDRIRDYIAQLPDKHREPLLMKEIEGLSHEDIARALGISVGASKLRVHRARLALRTLLDPLLGEVSK